MRVTNQSQMLRLLRDIRSNQEAFSVAQQQAASGKRIHRASDDPAAAARIMRLDRGLRAAEQFRANGSAARIQLTTEDEVLTSVRELLTRARGLVIATKADSPTDPQRQAALAEVQLIQEQIVALANSAVGDDYIFGGTSTAAPPFQSDGTYTGNSDVRKAEVDEGLRLDLNHAGDALFNKTIQALQNLTQELQTGTAATIQATLNGLRAADTQVLTDQTEIGARLQQLDSIDGQLAARIGNHLDHKEELESVDSAEALLKVLSVQSAMERAFAVIGRVLDTSLLNHIR